MDSQWQIVLGQLGAHSPITGIDDFRDGGVLPFPMHASHAIVSCGGFFGCITCGALSSGFQCGPFAEVCRHRISAGSKWRVHGLARGKLPHFAKTWPDHSTDPQPWLLTAGQRAWEVEAPRAVATSSSSQAEGHIDDSMQVPAAAQPTDADGDWNLHGDSDGGDPFGHSALGLD